MSRMINKRRAAIPSTHFSLLTRRCRFSIVDK